MAIRVVIIPLGVSKALPKLVLAPPLLWLKLPPLVSLMILGAN
jgi:hypothetical protein